MTRTKVTYNLIDGAPVNVLDYSPTGDGVTDDKTEIDAALAATTTGRVDLAGGSYAYTGTITQANLDKLYNGTVIATNGTFALKAPGLRDLAKTGSINGSNLVDNRAFNVTHADLEVSNIFGGTNTDPNLIGQRYYKTQFTGDGSTVSRSVTAPFTITDLSPATTIMATGRRASDGVPLIYTVSNVTGYGTTSLTFDVEIGGAAPATGDLIEVVVLSNLDDGSADPTLISTCGYDNAVNPIMSCAFGAHGVIGNGSGHNVILGGSYGRIYGGYSTIANGQSNYIGLNDSMSVGCFIAGRGIALDGADSIAVGLGHAATGDFCFYSGALHENNDVARVTMSGTRGLAQSVGERIHAGGKSTDTETGLYQVRELVLSGNTTDATLTNLTNSNNGSTQVVPAKSAAMLRVEVAAIKDDYTKMEAFQGDFLLTEDNAGNCLVDGLATDQALTSIANIGTPGYTAAARGAGGGLLIRVTGAASENVRWVAYCRIVQTRYV